MIVDTHHHLWLINQSDLWWLSEEERKIGGPHLNDFGPTEMREAFDTVGVQHSVLVEAWADEHDQHYWLNVAEQNKTIGAVIAAGDFSSPQIGELTDRLQTYSKFRGLRLVGQGISDSNYLARDDIRRGVRDVASRDNVSIDLLLKIEDLKDVPRLAEENPKLPMVLNHLAKPQTSQAGYFIPWAEKIELLKPYPHIKFKISGMLTEAGPNPAADLLRPAVQFMIETFGRDRLMWGSDWPVSLQAGSYRDNFEMTMDAVGPMDATETETFLSQNAIDYYRIETAEEDRANED